MTASLIVILFLTYCLSSKSSPTNRGGFSKDNTLPLRGVLALLIVSHHLGMSTNIPFISSATSNIGTQIVAIFFFMSGYGLCKSYQYKGAVYLEGFMNKRLGKLLPKFLILSGLVMLIHWSFSDFGLGEQLHEILHNGYTPLPNTWFIVSIIYVYSAFYICARLKNNTNICIAFALSSFVYIVTLIFVLRFPLYWSNTILMVNVGYLFALYEDKVSAIINRGRKPLKTLLSLVVVSLACMLYCEYMELDKLLMPIKLCWIFVITVSVYSIISTIGFRKSRILDFFGIISLEIYLIHGAFIELGNFIGLNDYFLWIFTYSLTIPSAYILYRYWKIPSYMRSVT